MALVKVLLADDNIGILTLLGDYLDRKIDIRVVAKVTDGMQAMDAILEYSPDVVVIDIVMPRRDGFSVLAEIRRMPSATRPKVIMLSGLSQETVIARAFSMGVDYFILKPYEPCCLYEHIMDVVDPPEERAAAVAQTFNNTAEKLSNLLLTLGIPANLKGYQYLRDGILMVIDNYELINHITKELYPAVAEKHGATATKVERAMRHAIGVAWNRGRVEAANELWDCPMFSADNKATNGEFIAMLADRLRKPDAAS